MIDQVIMDIECYKDYFLVKFLRLGDMRMFDFEQYEGKHLNTDGIKDFLKMYEVVTFNGSSYDVLMLDLALSGVDCDVLKTASDKIIKGKLKGWRFYKEYKLKESNYNHVDLIELCIGKSGLKTYAGRLHAEKLQDMPFSEECSIKPQDRTEVKKYCGNDLISTLVVLKEVTPQLDLRRAMSKKYACDLRSKSDAQIAEIIIKSEIAESTNINFGKSLVPEKTFKYDVPQFIKPSTNKLDEVIKILEEKEFKVNEQGNVEMPRELLTMKIKIGSSVYQMGIGGLHSTEKSIHHKEDHNFIIVDFDVTSYYPTIILNCELYPKQFGPEFLTVYRKIVEERIFAKINNDMVKANALKITINGSFGKFGSVYSALYSPKLMIQVTITGQLALLCLIDDLEAHGIKVVSANTDGIVIKCQRNKEQVMLDIIESWQTETGFNMERCDYAAVYSKDVNNYIAVKHDKRVKLKGCFKNADIGKNPSCDICNDAVVAYLTDNIDIEKTIKSCYDITKFIALRNVAGGAVKNNHYIGKTIRWYYSKNVVGTIKYRTNNNDVPKSNGAQHLMELPDEFPKDIDYDWYIKETKEMLNTIGIQATGQMTLGF